MNLLNANSITTARWTNRLVLTFRVPADRVSDLLPGGLELVTRGPWAFWRVEACRVEQERSGGLLGVVGRSYTRLSYALCAQAMNDRAELRRGFTEIHRVIDGGVASRLRARRDGRTAIDSTLSITASDCGIAVAQGLGASDSASASDLQALHAPASHVPWRSGSCFPTVSDARAFTHRPADMLSIVMGRGTDATARLRIMRHTRQGAVGSETPLRLTDSRSLAYFESIGLAEHVGLEWAARLSDGEIVSTREPDVPLLLQPRQHVCDTAPTAATPRPNRSKDHRPARSATLPTTTSSSAPA